MDTKNDTFHTSRRQKKVKKMPYPSLIHIFIGVRFLFVFIRVSSQMYDMNL